MSASNVPERTLFLDTHFYHLFALSHSLVLKTGQYPQELTKNIPLQNLKDLLNHLKAEIMPEQSVYRGVIDNIKNLIEPNRQIEKKDMKMLFFEFEKEEDRYIKRDDNKKLIYEYLKQYALDLPSSKYIQPINENNLKTNCINPFMQHLLCIQHK